MTLSRAVEKAHSVETETGLEIEARESLGSCYYHLGRFSEAEAEFNSVLELLAKAEGDVDVSAARERVERKMSNFREILHKKETASPTNSPTANLTGSQNPHINSRETSVDESAGLDEAQQDSRCVSGTLKKEQRRESRSSTPQSQQDSCDAQLQAYEKILNSSEDGSHSENEAEEGSSHLGTSSIEAPSPQGQGDINSQQTVPEGSLAIGVNARQLYTLQQSRAQNNGARQKTANRSTTEIVRVDQDSMRGQQEEVRGGQEDTDEATTPIPGSDHNNLRVTQHSKTCTVF